MKKPLLERWLAAIGLVAVSAASAAAAADAFPAYAPYAHPGANAMYKLLFCDDLAAFAAKPKETPVGWKVAQAAQPPDLAALGRVAADTGQDGRVRCMAHARLRQSSAQPAGRVLLGVITEVGLDGGLDTLAAFSDGGVRYINQSGRMVVAEGRTVYTAEQVDRLFDQVQAALVRMQPTRQLRTAPPPNGVVRYTFVTSVGPDVGQAPMRDIQRDSLGGPVLAAATDLLLAMIKLESR